MTTQLNQLTQVASVAAGDLSVLWSQQNGDARVAPMSVLAAYFNTAVVNTDNKVTQYASPNATGFTVTLTDSSGASVFLLLTPTGTFATGTITMPALANCIDKQEVLVTTTQTVTSLTVAPNGNTVNGAPTTLTANTFFRLRFDAVNHAWYRVG